MHHLNWHTDAQQKSKPAPVNLSMTDQVDRCAWSSWKQQQNKTSGGERKGKLCWFLHIRTPLQELSGGSRDYSSPFSRLSITNPHTFLCQAEGCCFVLWWWPRAWADPSRSMWVTHSSPFPTVPQHMQRCRPAALPTGRQHSLGPQYTAALAVAVRCSPPLQGAPPTSHTDGREPGTQSGQLASR